MNPLISVIVPIFHPQREYIDRLLDSIVRQTIGIGQIEVFLIVDGDNSAETREILEIWEKRFPDNIILIFYEENRKPGYARTLGIANASGEYIAFADQDDWISLEMYQVLYEAAVENNCEVAGSRYERETEYYRPEAGECADFKKELVKISSISDRKKFLMGDYYGGYWTAIYSRTFLSENDIYFPAGMTYDDNFFGMLVAYYVKTFTVVEASFYHWYINWESISMKTNEGFYLDRLRMEMKKIEELNKRGLLDIYHDEIECKFFGTFFMNTLHMIFCRLSEIPYPVYLYLVKTMQKLFPDYRKNYYIMEAQYKWCSLAVYQSIYDQYQELGEKAKGKIRSVIEEFPESLRGLSWLDLIDSPLSEEQLIWWKKLYMLKFVT